MFNIKIDNNDRKIQIKIIATSDRDSLAWCIIMIPINLADPHDREVLGLL
jgi:hypothetical protein